MKASLVSGSRRIRLVRGVIPFALILAGCGGAAPTASNRSPASQPAAVSQSVVSKPRPAASVSTTAQGSPSVAAQSSAKPASSGGSSAQPLRKLVQALPIDSFGFLPLYIARDKGFFQQEELDVETPIMASSVAVAGVVKGDVDLSIGDTSVRAAMQGAPVKAIMYFYNTVLFEFVASPAIKTLADLKGKAIGTSSRGSQEEVAASAALRQAGLDPTKDVTFVVVAAGTQLPSLVGGAIQAMMLNPDVGAVALNNGFHIVTSVQDVGKLLPLPFSGFVVSDSALKQKPDTIKAWIRANLKALQFIRSNPSESAAIATKALKLDPKAAEQAVPAAVQAINPDDLGGFSEEGFKLSVDENVKAMGGQAKVTQPDQLTDVTLLRQAQRELGVPCKTGYQCP